MFSLARKLKEKGVLGINERNANYTAIYNRRNFYPLVDDKLLTKELAIKAGMAVPKLYHVIEIPAQIRTIHEVLSKYDDFVVKPARGSGGEGILVISGVSQGKYRQINKKLLSKEELEHYVLNILGGMYSLGGHPDKAIIEYRVKFDPTFDPVSFLGVPDIRIIVLLGIPVMAMLRLPTSASGGKANLHQGAIGVGIDMKSGSTLTAVLKNEVVKEHPDTETSITGLQIPGWDNLLLQASKCFELTGLGYQGVDIVLDRDLGPLILEINARPGLNIQIANRAGLGPRLKLIEQEHHSLKTPQARVDFAKKNF